MLQCVSSAVELLGDRLRPHVHTICSALPQVCGGAVVCVWTGRRRCQRVAVRISQEWQGQGCDCLSHPRPACANGVLCSPAHPRCWHDMQVWGVINQQRQEGTGGLARLHSALISTGTRPIPNPQRPAPCTACLWGSVLVPGAPLAVQSVLSLSCGQLGLGTVATPGRLLSAPIPLPSAHPLLRPPAVTHLLMRLGSAAVADPRVGELLYPLLQHATNVGAPARAACLGRRLRASTLSGAGLLGCSFGINPS